MANSWFSNSLVSPLNPPATTGSLNLPPPDPPDPSSPSDFPSLASGLLLPRKQKKYHKSQISTSTTPSTIPPTEVTSAAQLLSSYLVSSSKSSLNPRSGPIHFGSETATVATVATKSLNSSYTTVVSPPCSQSLHGILGSAPSPLSQSSIPLAQSANPGYVIISGTSHPSASLQPPTSHVKIPSKSATDLPSFASKVKSSVDRSLKRLSPVSYSPSGIPRVEIPDEVFHKGAELHKDFIICKFFGRIPPYHLTQSVLNYMWG